MTFPGRVIHAHVELDDAGWTALDANVGDRVIVQVGDETIAGTVVHEGGRYLVRLACLPDESTDRNRVAVRRPRRAA